MAFLDLGVEVLEQPDSRAVGVVAGKLEEVELVRDGQSPREIGDEDEARLERRDEQRVSPLVLARERVAELANTRVELLTREVDIADADVD